jgi:hypothetical protein
MSQRKNKIVKGKRWKKKISGSNFWKCLKRRARYREK